MFFYVVSRRINGHLWGMKLTAVNELSCISLTAVVAKRRFVYYLCTVFR